MSDMLMFAE